ncbi:unnamed protein product [Knipowitschia caucasica]
MEPTDWPERKDIFQLCSDSLSIQEVIDATKSPKCGAVSVFLGTTREDELGGRKVIGLEYEAYDAMVQSELSKLSRVIRGRWPQVQHICVHHRLGWVAVGEASVAVAISAPHRRDSEEAIQFCVTQLKARVPIWKKEVYDDNQSQWNENFECSWSQKHQKKIDD